MNILIVKTLAREKRNDLVRTPLGQNNHLFFNVQEWTTMAVKLSPVLRYCAVVHFVYIISAAVMVCYIFSDAERGY